VRANNSKGLAKNFKHFIIENTSGLVDDIRSHLKKFNQLRDEKEKGLHVGFDLGKRQSSPATFSKERVEESLKEARNRYELAKPFLSISLTPSERRILETQLDETMKSGHKLPTETDIRLSPIES
jgi:hypothetical protein